MWCKCISICHDACKESVLVNATQACLNYVLLSHDNPTLYCALITNYLWQPCIMLCPNYIYCTRGSPPLWLFPAKSKCMKDLHMHIVIYIRTHTIVSCVYEHSGKESQSDKLGVMWGLVVFRSSSIFLVISYYSHVMASIPCRRNTNSVCSHMINRLFFSYYQYTGNSYEGFHACTVFETHLLSSILRIFFTIPHPNCWKSLKRLCGTPVPTSRLRPS